MSSLRPVVRFIASTSGKSKVSKTVPPQSPLVGYLEIACVVKPNARGRPDSILDVLPDRIELCVLGVPKSDVEISKGATSHYKVLTIHNIIADNMVANAKGSDGKSKAKKPKGQSQDSSQTESSFQEAILDIFRQAAQRSD
ncbi:hypothetical protein AJ80_03877 [Polytolypa hystricis UAMH7299]|uniref:Uncharacterized protein n=1 Tax=Polytolypa hystricis (strain UAMH7299) TaxID=1447883 RepID=A0A2B7YER2_POLH7|nr:hypothetical protein AJ80_03877 [Polytolypa hystricis UAMH7299]